MTICDVCESKGKTTKCEVTLKIKIDVEQTSIFDLCDDCLDLFHFNQFRIGMITVRNETQKLKTF